MISAYQLEIKMKDLSNLLPFSLGQAYLYF